VKTEVSQNLNNPFVETKTTTRHFTFMYLRVSSFLLAVAVAVVD